MAELVKKYARHGDWQAAKENTAVQAKSPQTSLLMSFARITPERLEAAMQKDPSLNIFEEARRIANENKKNTRKPARKPNDTL